MDKKTEALEASAGGVEMNATIAWEVVDDDDESVACSFYTRPYTVERSVYEWHCMNMRAALDALDSNPDLSYTTGVHTIRRTGEGYSISADRDSDNPSSNYLAWLIKQCRKGSIVNSTFKEKNT